MDFWKFHGSGNDFIILDGRDKRLSLSGDYIRFLCRRHTGIGSDGLIILEQSSNAPFHMRYYNSDGLEGTMCGNGGRCITAFAHMAGIIKEDSVRFSASDGLHLAQVLNVAENGVRKVMIKMKNVVAQSDSFMDTGSPHHIEFVHDLNEKNLMNKGRKIRHSTKYKSINGANVNFVKAMEENRIGIRTFERGVEDETLSCGTGATAAALAWALKKHTTNGPVYVEAPGGLLEVTFKRKNNTFKEIWLTGPTQFVFRGTI